MFWFLVNWFITALALLITAYVMPGFHVKNFKSAFISAAIIGLVNVVIRPVFLFLAFPINFLTLGLFTFVINAALLKIAAYFAPGFEITSWFSAIFGAVVLSLVGNVLIWILQIG